VIGIKYRYSHKHAHVRRLLTVTACKPADSCRAPQRSLSPCRPSLSTSCSPSTYSNELHLHTHGHVHHSVQTSAYVSYGGMQQCVTASFGSCKRMSRTTCLKTFKKLQSWAMIKFAPFEDEMTKFAQARGPLTRRQKLCKRCRNRLQASNASQS
jgi:hypothetical protein